MKLPEEVRLNSSFSDFIREVPGSKLGRDTYYPDMFRQFLQSHATTAIFSVLSSPLLTVIHPIIQRFMIDLFSKLHIIE